MIKPPLNILKSDSLAGAGIGLKPSHYQEILETSPDLGWFEVHAENYMGEGGAPHHYLEKIVQQYPLSIHGVGLSIGGREPLDKAHLARLKRLNERYKPALFSEHLAWSSHEGQFYNDLLPLPYLPSTLQSVCNHIDQFQDVLGRQILLENPSTYIRYAKNSYSEPEFLGLIAEKTGCGLLLDVNNVYVSASNNDFSAKAFIDNFDLASVKEIHLAGHTVERHICEDGTEQLLRIDDHGCLVCEDVWALYEYTLHKALEQKKSKKAGVIPTLIERDNDIPSLSELVGEARQAQKLITQMELSHG